MSEANFTKGPWIFVQEDGCRKLKSTNGLGAMMCDEEYYPWVPNNVSDWYLIAAAPEMYRELKDIADNHTESPYQEELYRLLAKARGEA